MVWTPEPRRNLFVLYAIMQTEKPRLTNLPAKHRILTDMQWSPEVVRNHAVGKSLERLILHNAETILQQPPAERELTGRRLLTISRLVLYRVNSLCMAYHLTGKKDYADRAIREMPAAAKFSDWNLLILRSRSRYLLFPLHFRQIKTVVSIGP